MEGDVSRSTEDETMISSEVHRPPPLNFYPIANDLELLVLSVCGSLPDWVIPLRESSTSEVQVRKKSRRSFEDSEDSRVEIARQEREFISDLKSRFGGDYGNPEMFEFLHSLEICHPKKLTNPANNDQTKTLKNHAVNPSSQGSQTPRSKRTRPDSLEESNRQLKSQKPASSLLKDGGIKPEKVKNSKKIDKKELTARKSHPWDAICREESFFSSQFCITSVAEALLISRIGKECIVPSPILPCPVIPSPTIREPDINKEEEGIGSILKSFPGLIRNTELFNLATNGASSLDPTWANKLDFQWALCDEELMTGDCEMEGCRFQHKKEYLLHGPELESHRYSRGSIDNCRNACLFDVSFLRWTPPESTQIAPLIKDDIPVYERSSELQCFESGSSLFRSINFDLEKLRLQSIQPELSCACPSPLSFSFEVPTGSPEDVLRIKDPQTVDEIVIKALRMIDWGTGESANSLPCLQEAIKFLTNQLERFPTAPHLFQFYLMLLARDPSIELETKLTQFELYFEKHGSWYRGTLMMAGMYINIKDKIRIYENGISALLKSSESSIPSLETCRCTVDLFLRIMFLELKLDPHSFTRKDTFSFSLRHLKKKVNKSDTQSQPTPSMTLIESFYDGLCHYPSERFLFGTCVLHGYLYKQLPIEIINSFGFPKQFRVLNWKIVLRAIPQPSLSEIRDYVFALMTSDATGPTFFTLSAPMETKQVFATNVLLLLEAAGLTNPAFTMKLFLQRDDSTSMERYNQSECLFLDIAETLDDQLDKEYPLNGASHNGSGFIVEQLMNHMFHHGRKNEVETWFLKKEFNFDELKGYRMILASMKLSLFFDTVSQALKDHSEEDFEKTSRTEQGLYYLTQMLNCILNKMDDPEMIQGYLKKALKSAQGLPQLKKTVWSEAVLLSVLALPTEDPRRDQQKVQDKSGLSLSVVEKYLRERESAFGILMSLIGQYCDEAVPVLRGLDNTQERCTSNPRLDQVLTPTSTFEICPLLDTLRVVLPHLMQSEVLKLMEFVIGKFGNCPSLAEFLIHIRVYLPDHDRLFLKSLVQVVMCSTPCARIEVWQQVIKIATQYGHHLSEELESHAKRLYPGWQDDTS